MCVWPGGGGGHALSFKKKRKKEKKLKTQTLKGRVNGKEKKMSTKLCYLYRIEATSKSSAFYLSTAWKHACGDVPFQAPSLLRLSTCGRLGRRKDLDVLAIFFVVRWAGRALLTFRRSLTHETEIEQTRHFYTLFARLQHCFFDDRRMKIET